MLYNALIVQWIEQLPSKQSVQVRFLVGVLIGPIVQWIEQKFPKL